MQIHTKQDQEDRGSLPALPLYSWSIWHPWVPLALGRTCGIFRLQLHFGASVSTMERWVETGVTPLHLKIKALGILYISWT